jgi:hypothetical protein
VATIENLNLRTKISNDGLALLASLPRLKCCGSGQPPADERLHPHILRLEALVELQIHGTTIDQDGVDQLTALPNLQDLCLDVRDGNYSFHALLRLSARMPRCTILAKGRGEFCGGTFDVTWDEVA